jgi:hypothetical protein
MRRRHSQAVRQKSAKLLFPSSILGVAFSIKKACTFCTGFFYENLAIFYENLANFCEKLAII